MLFGSGLSLTQIAARSAGSGGGGGDYHADAVHFGGDASFHIDSLTAPGDDTGFCSFSLWVKMTGAHVAEGLPLWVSNPEDVYDMSSGPQGASPIWASTFADATGTNDMTVNTIGAGAFPTDTWVNVLVSCQTNLGVASKILQVYLNDTAYTFNIGDVHGAFLMTFTGFSFWVGDDSFGDFITADMADFWCAPGVFIDFDVEANRRKFIDDSGKPVYLGANGEIPTGTSPSVFFSGDATTFGNNLGTGGTFTAAGSLTDASTSPSD